MDEAGVEAAPQEETMALLVGCERRASWDREWVMEEIIFVVS
jgi:hypothetical protein